MKTIDDLINFCEGLNGDKILTGSFQLLAASKGRGFSGFSSHICKNNTWEHGKKTIVDLIKNNLPMGLTLRHFQEIFFLEKYKGKEIKVPYKHLYGFFVSESGVVPQTEEELKYSFETDCHTGKPLPPEKGLFYKEIEKN